jgi:hypothetical protein
MVREHQQTRGYEILAAPCGTCKPAAGDDPGAFGADVVAALRYLTEVID